MNSAPVLAVRDLALGYGPRVVLSGVSLELSRGEYLGIVGPNGSGKSTFLMGLLGLLTPRSGAIVHHVPLRFGYVPQSSAIDPIFPLSVDDVVRMGPGITGPDATVDVDRLLARVRLEAQRGRAFRELSGGQKQRVLLARALAMNPDFLILDEPTNGLDLPSEMDFLDLVREFHHEGRNIIMVTHFLNLVANQADKIALIGDGRVTVGHGAEILTSETLSRVYGVPIQVGEAEGHRFVLPPATPERTVVTEITSGSPAPEPGGKGADSRTRATLSVACLAGMTALAVTPAIEATGDAWPLADPGFSLLAIGLFPVLGWIALRHLIRRRARHDTLERAVDALGLLLAGLMVSEVIARFVVGGASPAFVPEVTSALLVGSAGAWILARASAAAGIGLGMGLFLTAVLVGGALHRLPDLVQVFHQAPPVTGMLLGALHCLIAAILFRLVAGAHRRQMEMPPRFLEQDGLPVRVRVPFLMLGIWPLLIAGLLARVIHATFVGARDVFGQYGSWLDGLLLRTEAGSWGGALLTGLLLFLATPLAFRLLYPRPRLATLSGHGHRDLETVLRPWVENELVQQSVYLVLIVLASHAWLGGPLAALGWGALALPVVVGTTVEIAETTRMRRRLERDGRAAVRVASAADPLEAAILQTKLKQAGIHAALDGWSPRSVLPLTATSLAVTGILVAAADVDRATALLAAGGVGGHR